MPETPVDPFGSAELGPITLRNRFVKAATFEGMAIKNQMSDAIIDFHSAQADGGIGMTTLAYCAVSRDGQGAPNEIVLRAEAVPGLRGFTEAMHDRGARASVQLGHAGPVGGGRGSPGLSASRVFAPQRMKFNQAADEADLETAIADFAKAAELATDAGFDCIELHFGHGYLISNFMSPKLNKRDDRWGGSVENRARLAREVAARVRDAAGDHLAVIAKINMADGVPRGLWLDESVQIAKLLESDGALDALELTGGSSFENPMYLFRGEAPVQEMAQVFPKALRLGFKLTASKFMKTYPFEEGYFLPYARQFRAALKMPLILLGGINRLETVEQALAEGFDFVSMGRALLRDPGLLNRWQSGERTESLCVHCNKCMPSIYAGTHCVLVEPDQRPGHDHWPPPRGRQPSES
jgi:2,4-dienoyl-CoA reductase-like NADH-dependent reductase (Old Yellow Enzyme family)